MTLVVTPLSSAAVSSTEVRFGLLGVGTNGNQTSNITVHRLDISFSDPAAVFEVSVGRIEISDDGSTAGADELGRLFHESTDIYLPKWRIYSQGFHHVLGHYYHSGPAAFVLSFEEFVEALADAESSTDQVFGFSVKRIDSDDYVTLRANAWSEAYN